jgi:antirestriction protein ArdC
MPTNTENYERITATLIQAIETTGELPWERPWKGADHALSMSTRKPYRGVNQWVLGLTAMATPGYTPWWGTYKQIEALGGQVRKGEKSTPAILWKPFEKMVDGKVEKFMMMRVFSVFNAGQADGLPERFYTVPEPGEIAEIPEAAAIFDGYTDRYSIPVNRGTAAFYTPATDAITLPPIESFVSSSSYYATAFHEAAHSTGHQTRLNRPGVADFDHFGSHQYSREELVAEMTSAMVAGVLEIEVAKTTDNHVAYLKNWLNALKEDAQAVVWAAGRAQKAADLIFGLELEEES